jgi:hypothetical protein
MIMKLPCAVTRDLLPLYTENMVEQETRVLVEEHLDECADCRAKFSEMNVPAENPVDTVKPLQNLKKQIRIKRLRAVLIASLCVFIALFTVFFRADSPVLLPWTEGLIQVKGVETVTPEQRIGRTYQMLPGETTANYTPQSYTGEALILGTDSSITGIMSDTAVEDDGTTTVFLQATGRDSRSMNLGTAEGELVFCPVPDRVIYGYGEPQQLLWGEPMNGGAQVLPRLALGYYLLIALPAAGGFGLLWFLFRKRSCSRILRQLFFAPVSYILSHLLLKGMKTTSFFMDRDLLSILLVALAIYALLTIAWQMFLTRRKEA